LRIGLVSPSWGETGWRGKQTFRAGVVCSETVKIQVVRHTNQIYVLRQPVRQGKKENRGGVQGPTTRTNHICEKELVDLGEP
jgi:hypothetical protein